LAVPLEIGNRSRLQTCVKAAPTGTAIHLRELAAFLSLEGFDCGMGVVIWLFSLAQGQTGQQEALPVVLVTPAGADVTLTMDTGIYAAGEVHTSQASCSGVVGGVVRPVYFV
jgi:hypothetical protein